MFSAGVSVDSPCFLRESLNVDETAAQQRLLFAERFQVSRRLRVGFTPPDHFYEEARAVLTEESVERALLVGSMRQLVGRSAPGAPRLLSIESFFETLGAP